MYRVTGHVVDTATSSIHGGVPVKVWSLSFFFLPKAGREENHMKAASQLRKTYQPLQIAVFTLGKGIWLTLQW